MFDDDDWYDKDADRYDDEPGDPDCGACYDRRIGCASCNPNRWQLITGAPGRWWRAFRYSLSVRTGRVEFDDEAPF